MKNDLYITNSYNKKKMLSNAKKLSNKRIIDVNEFLKRYTFSYDEEAIYYIMKKYHVVYAVAKIYLENLIYSSDLSSKTRFLSELKEDLINNNLLKIDKLFQNFARSNKVVFYQHALSKDEKKLYEDLNYEVELSHNSFEHSIHEFKNVEEEINFVCNKIIELINQGIDINNIKLLNVKDDSKQIIYRLFKFYNIPISCEKSSLYAYNATLKFLDKLRNSRNIQESIDYLKELHSEEENDIINILNKYTFIKEVDDEYIECLINEFKNKKKKIKLQNEIEIIDFEDEITKEYVFLLGFNDELPKTYKDESYISDEIKEKLGFATSIDKNIYEENKVLNCIKNIKNLTITYSKKVISAEHNISKLNETLNYEIIKTDYQNYSYSNIYNEITLTKYLDKLNKFNIKNKDLEYLLYNYEIPYQKYDNSFKGIEKEDLYKYLDEKLLLSYSSMDNYYKCGFRYYLNNILKITNYEETFAIKIGNIFHEMLSLAFKDNFDFENSWKEIISKTTLDHKEEVFIVKLKEDLKFIIDTINKQNKLTTLTEEMYEHKIFINKDRNIKVTFMGVIDKLKYKKVDGKTLVAIIDYKTGSPNTSLTNSIYGLDMQLPVYLYLANNLERLENVEIVGFYLQKILNNEINYNPKKDYLKEKQDNLKLEGYSIDNYELLEQFDSSFKDSEMIKSMKIGNNGFYAYSKTISKEQVDNLIKLVDTKIDESIDNIIECNFKINPKKIKNETTCSFCPYKVICYLKEEDIVELEEIKDLDFLKG